MSVTIFHNPACGTSRNVLGLIRHAGIEPVVIEYLKTPPGRDELVGLGAGLLVGLSRTEGGQPDAKQGDERETQDQVRADAGGPRCGGFGGHDGLPCSASARRQPGLRDL